MDENHAKYEKIIEDTDKRLKGLVAKWVLRYDYFGFLFSLVRRKAEVGFRNPAAVASTPQGTLELIYNPILLSATSDEDLNEILHHEGLHILNKHLSRMMRILAEYPKTQWEPHRGLINKAVDCCVNQQGKIKNPLIIAGAPFRLHFPEDLDLKPDRMMEEYYHILLERERLKEKAKQDSGEDNTEKSENPEDEKSKGDKNDSKDKEDNKSNESGKPDNPQTSDKDSDQKSDGREPEGPVQRDEEGNDENGDGDVGDDDGGEQNPGRGRPSRQGKPDESEGTPSRGHNQNQEIDDSDLGNHTRWMSENIPDPHATSRRIDTYTQRIIRESAKNYQRSKNRGKMPGYIQDLIEQALRPAPIPYYEIIRQLVKGSKIGKYKRSSTHINRKRTYVFQLADENIPMISPFPGRKRDMSFKIGVIIDTSSSQTPDDILDGLSGCKNIIEKDRHCDTTILEVDTIIHKEYKLKKVSDIDFDVKGRGGTTLLPGIERCKELNVDVCICFTDGFTENFNEISRRVFPKRMIWVITPKGSDEKLNKVGYTVFLPERIDE